ncbi:MAG TPA: DUF4258 domain-containing protein [Rhizobiales bacterium]|nr:hypothetical protein BMS3Bbin10_02978 [bacterium BMS3Bbin10]HDO52775.1 DUF4258 domain-containing protein [Hyphomicrobiales bacterium]
MPKKLILTAHARERLQSRKIKLEWVEGTVRTPDWSEADPDDPGIERRFRAIRQFGGRTLRVACVETGTTIRVISAMFDRSARRKP